MERKYTISVAESVGSLIHDDGAREQRAGHTKNSLISACHGIERQVTTSFNKNCGIVCHRQIRIYVQGEWNLFIPKAKSLKRSSLIGTSRGIIIPNHPNPLFIQWLQRLK